MSNFDEQEFIMSNFVPFVKQSLPIGYKRFIPIAGMNPVLVDHTLKRTPNISPFMRITPQDYSKLIPQISLYKVFFDKEGKEKEQLRIPFPTSFTKEEVSLILENKAGRGVGSGIINFDWTYNGKDPAESKTYIQSNLKIFLSSIEELTRPRGLGVSYLDLITRTQRFSKNIKDMVEGEQREISENYFDIKIVINYSAPNSLDPDLQEAIRNSAVTLYLELNKHDIEFKENGSVEINIDYYGRTSTVLAEENVLQEGEHDKILKAMAEVKGVRTVRIGIDRGTSDVGPAFEFFNLKFISNNSPEFVGPPSTITTPVNHSSYDSLYKNNIAMEGDYKFQYFTFGDLLDAALKNTYLPEYRLLLGSVVLEQKDDIMGSTYYSVNMADLPISLKKYKEWYKEHIAGESVKELSVLSFLDKAFSYLVKDVISKASPAAVIPKLNYTTFTVPYDGSTDPLFNTNYSFGPFLDGPGGELYPIKRGSMTPQVVKEIENSKKVGQSSQRMHYLYMGATQKTFHPSMISPNVSKALNENLAIYHFANGVQLGPTKSVKFKKMDLPFQKEAAIEKGGGLMSQYLRTYYNADIEMIGAPFFYPGSMIYIDSKTMRAGDPTVQNSLANILGLGGYYMVISAKNSISANNYNTSLDCVNLAFQGLNQGSGGIDIQFLDGSTST